MKVEFAIFLMLLFVTSAAGQKASDIEKEFGKPTQVYSLSDHIWMTPEYGIDGEICRARLYPKGISPTTSYLSREMPFYELRGVLNRLVPPAQRGFTRERFGETELGGGIGWTTYQYENVSIVFHFTAKVDPEALQQAKSYSVEDFPILPKQEILPSYKDIPHGGPGIEIVTIHWTNRTCGN